jgi:hypothetical protein
MVISKQQLNDWLIKLMAAGKVSCDIDQLDDLDFCLEEDAKLDHPYKVGENYFIRMVTFHYTGRITTVYNNEIVLSKACWIPDDGRFADALKTGNFNEVEPYPCENDVILGRGAIIDASIFNHPLPSTQK